MVADDSPFLNAAAHFIGHRVGSVSDPMTILHTYDTYIRARHSERTKRTGEIERESDRVDREREHKNEKEKERAQRAREEKKDVEVWKEEGEREREIVSVR